MPPRPSKKAGSKSDACSSQQQSTNSQAYTTIPRDWPTWPPQHTRTTQTSPPLTDTSVTEPTPMQRWMNETTQQGSWNNIAAAEVGRERYGEGPDRGLGGKGSAAGTWGSRSE